MGHCRSNGPPAVPGTAPYKNDNGNGMETRSNLDRTGKQSSASVVAVGGLRDHDVDHEYLFTRQIGNVHMTDRLPGALLRLLLLLLLLAAPNHLHRIMFAIIIAM